MDLLCVDIDRLKERYEVHDDHKWGYEVWLENQPEYCAKLLVVYSGWWSSLHAHETKKETFIVWEGMVEIEVGGQMLVPLKVGDSVRIEPGTQHRFRSITNRSTVLEVSCFEDDLVQKIEQAKRREVMGVEIAEQRVFVFGDLIIDKYVDGRVDRISPEAPVPILASAGETILKLGGSGNAAANITSMGVQATLFGGCSSRQREAIHQLCSAARVDDSGVLQIAVSAPEKTRFIANAHHILRWDVEVIMTEASVESDAYANTIIDDFNAKKSATAILLSDYDKGFLPTLLIHDVIYCAEEGIPIIVDPKAKPLAVYAGADVVKMNLREFCQYADLSQSCSDEQMLEVAGEMMDGNDIGAIIVTLGGDGMKVMERGNAFLWHVPGKEVPVTDVTGAGDTVAAALAVCLGMGMTLQESARVANALAAKTVQQSGCGYTTLEDLETAIEYPDL